MPGPWRIYALVLLAAAWFAAAMPGRAQSAGPRAKNFFYFETGDWGVEDARALQSPRLPEDWRVAGDTRREDVLWIKNDPVTRNHASPQGDRLNKLLQLNLIEGRAVALETAPFAVAPGASCVLNGYMKSQGNFVSDTTLTIRCLDAQGRVLKTVRSASADYSPTWREMRTSFFTVPEGAVQAVIGIDSRSKGSTGTVWIDQILLRNYNLDFEVDNDEDQFPDNWKRYYNDPEDFRTFPGNKAYLDMTPGAPSGAAALRMDLQEGRIAAMTESFIEVDPQGSFRFSCFLKTTGDPRLDARAEIWFYNRRFELLPGATLAYDRVQGSKYWNRDQPFQKYVERVADPEARYARIRLVLNGNGAISGSAWFDRVEFVPQPRIDVVPLHPGFDPRRMDYDPETLFLFAAGETPRFRVTAGNLPDDTYSYDIVVTDFWNREVHAERTPPTEVTRKEGHSLRAEFSVPHAVSGYRRIHVQLWRGAERLSGKQASYGIVPGDRLGGNPQSRVGVTVDPLRGDDATLAPLLGHLGCGFVKMPAWYPDMTLSAEPQESSRRLFSLARRVRQMQMQPVGMFTPSRIPQALRPPLADAGDDANSSLAAMLSGAPERWQGYVRKSVETFGPLIDWWQLGDDEDTSFLTRADGLRTATDFAAFVRSTASWARVGLLDGTLPRDAQTGLDYLLDRVDPEAGQAGVQRTLTLLGEGAPHRWIGLTVRDNRDDTRVERVEVLVKQMIQALRSESARAYFTPFVDDFTGLLTADLQPKPEYFAARTVTDLIGAAKPVDSLDLGNPRINNQIFMDGDAMIMVLWTDGPPITEDIYLGEDLTRIDIMGVRERVGVKNQPYRLDIGSMPVFYTGINRELLLTRLSMTISPDARLDSTIQPQKKTFTLTNHFDHELGGVVRIRYPIAWKLTPSELKFTSLAPGASQSWDVSIAVNRNDDVGDSTLLLDYTFTVNNDTHTNMTDRRRLRIGSPLDMAAVFSRKTGKDGTPYLEGVMEFINGTTVPVTVRCEFIVLGDAATRVRERLASGVQPRQRLPLDALMLPADVEGKTLRVWVQEVGGERRFMNKEFIIKPVD